MKYGRPRIERNYIMPMAYKSLGEIHKLKNRQKAVWILFFILNPSWVSKVGSENYQNTHSSIKKGYRKDRRDTWMTHLAKI